MVIDTMRKRWTRHIAGVGAMRNMLIEMTKNLHRRDHLGHTGLCGQIMLPSILEQKEDAGYIIQYSYKITS
jgi:hypothetical protein